MLLKFLAAHPEAGNPCDSDLVNHQWTHRCLILLSGEDVFKDFWRYKVFNASSQRLGPFLLLTGLAGRAVRENEGIEVIGLQTLIPLRLLDWVS